MQKKPSNQGTSPSGKVGRPNVKQLWERFELGIRALCHVLLDQEESADLLAESDFERRLGELERERGLESYYEQLGDEYKREESD